MLINGYRLLSELKSDNSGFAKWGFAEKNGTEFFIKQFLSPVYPVDKSILSEEQINRKMDICGRFEEKKKRFYDRLSRCATGNIITVVDFFRFESKYYVVTEKVETKALTVNEISQLPAEKKLLILKTILYNISALHKQRIVHADIKPNNILIKETINGFYTAKLIDFDSGFCEDDKDVQTNTEGDLVYLSPEVYMTMLDEPGSADTKLTHKMDIFALGIVFHQYLTGKLPAIDKREYNYIFEAVLDGGTVTPDASLGSELCNIMRKMMNLSPSERPEAHDIFELVSEMSKGGTKMDTSTVGSASKLKSTMRMHEASAGRSAANSFLKPAGDF